MVLYTASLEQEWKDFTEKHKIIREHIEHNIESYLRGSPQNLMAIWAPFRQGKTQLLYNLFRFVWKNGGISFFTNLENIIPDQEMGASEFKDYIENLLENSIENLKNNQFEEISILNNDTKDYLQKYENLEINGDCVVLLVDEMEQKYKKLLSQVLTDDKSPLRELTAQRKFMVIAAFAPTSFYEALCGEAEKGRWETFKIPLIYATDIKNKNENLGNFIWWVSKGRVGLAYKMIDLVESNKLENFRDFADFAEKDIGRIDDIQSIDTKLLASYSPILNFIKELYPHPIDDRIIEHGLSKGKILNVQDFLKITRKGLKQLKWEDIEIEYFLDYLSIILDAISQDDQILFPVGNTDDKDAERILTIFKAAVDYAMEIEGIENENMKSLIEKIDKWKNFAQFYWTTLFPEVNKVIVEDKEYFILSYDLIPQFFPLPISSPIIGTETIDVIKEYLLSNHPEMDNIARIELKIEDKGYIDYLFFINEEKLNNFLKTEELNEYLKPNKGLICVLLSGNKNNIISQGVSDWLKSEKRFLIENTSELLSDFLLSVIYTGQLYESDDDLFDNIAQLLDDNIVSNKSLHRRVSRWKSVLKEFTDHLSENISFNIQKFELNDTDKKTIGDIITRQSNFFMILGLSFVGSNELKTFHKFRTIIDSDSALKGLSAGVTGLLSKSSVFKRGKKYNLHSSLEKIRSSFNKHIKTLQLLSNLVSNSEDFCEITLDEISKTILRGVFYYFHPNKAKKKEIIDNLSSELNNIEDIRNNRLSFSKILNNPIEKSLSEQCNSSIKKLKKLVETELTSGYLENLICSFVNNIIIEFNDEILQKDQNHKTNWIEKCDYISNFNEYLKDLQDLDDNLFKVLQKEKNEIIYQFQELFKNKLDESIIDNFNNRFDWASYPEWNDFWGEFEEEFEKIKTDIISLKNLEEPIKSLIKLGKEINTKLKESEK